MKTIYLIRHAEAAAKQNGCSDYQRPLTAMGVVQADKLGTYLNSAAVRFDRIVSSHAARALQTARGIAKMTDFPEAKILIEQSIYAGNLDSYLNIIFSQPDEISHLAFVGHNPHITGLANYLMKEEKFFLTPAAMAAFKFSTDKWTDICLAAQELFLVWPSL